MAAELFWVFRHNERMNKKTIIQGILKWRKWLKWKSDNCKYGLSDYIIDLQYLVHAGDKFIGSVFCYLSQSNGY